MRSAWMLTTVGLVALILAAGGCMQPGWGISPPVARTEPPAPEPKPSGQPPAATQPANAVATRPHADEEDSSDPTVAELARRIEQLAEQSSAAQPSAAAASQPVELTAAPPEQPAPPAPTLPTTTAPAPVAAAAPPATPDSAKPEPAAQPATAPAPIVAAPIDEPPATPMVANAPTPQPGDNARSTSEEVASPTPRQIPLIQPTRAAPAVTVEITDIRAVISNAATEPEAHSAAANQPAQADGQPKTADLESVIDRMEASVQAKPPHPQDELQLRLLYLAAGLTDKSAAPVRGMDPIQTELLTAIVKTVASARQAMLDPTSASPTALASADELRRLLGQQSGVSIPRVALVTKVASYGDYDVISPLRFKAGHEIHAYVYTEIANFRSEPTEDDRLRTLVAERVQVFEASGKMVWERYEKSIEDRTRTPRRDFFIPFPLKLPATLAPGEYVLKVTIEDRIGGTTDQQRLSFSIQ